RHRFLCHPGLDVLNARPPLYDSRKSRPFFVKLSIALEGRFGYTESIKRNQCHIPSGQQRRWLAEHLCGLAPFFMS
ncbi:MAG: hypothetical protein ACI4OD_06025, partial [Selenomonas sp.]